MIQSKNLILFFLILICLYISMGMRNIYLLGALGHGVIVMNIVLYTGIDKKNLYFFLGHLFLMFNCFVAMMSHFMSKERIDETRAIIGTSSHLLLGYHFLKLFLQEDSKDVRRYFYFSLVFANIGFIFHYRKKYMKNYMEGDNTKLIFYQSLIVVFLFSIYNTYTLRNKNTIKKKFSNTIMSTYFLSQLYLIHSNIDY
jgi:hypothetical protein